MDLQAEKLNLINWLSQLSDESIISKIKALRNEKADWWDEISEDEKADIEKGVSQLNKGEGISHKEVKQKFEKWL